MLPNWKHPVFDQERGSKVGKVATTVVVCIRYALGEGHREVPLMTVGEIFAIGQRAARKVVTGKLYDAEGQRLESIFRKTHKVYLNDPINWDEEVQDALNISYEEVVYKFDHQDGKNADLPMLGAPTKVSVLKPVKAILERTPNFPQRVVFKKNQLFENQVITNVVTREAQEEVYRQVSIKTFRQQETVEQMEQSADTPLSVDTTTGAALKREQMELGSLINKIRRVTEAQ